MTSLIYANANSLFDYSNGASRSLLLLLETWAASGVKVYAITSCVSDSQEGFDFSLKYWKSIKNESHSRHPAIKRFHLNHIHHTLISNSSYLRHRLESSYVELIYRETEQYLARQRNSNEKMGFLSWGNLLLEESLFKQAKAYGCRTMFYLANPSYLGKFPATLQIADYILTDSNATKGLYGSEVKGPIKVMPKIVGPNSSKASIEERWRKQNIYFVNPSLNKGLQYAVELAFRCLSLNFKYKFIFVDAAGKLNTDLFKLEMPTEKLPNNIEVKNGTPSVDDLLIDASIILLPSIWHESGSRLILEGHKRGIPVLAFATGGTSEFMAHAIEDLFQKPESKSHWDSSSLVIRIEKLLTDFRLYSDHSIMLRNHSIVLEQKNRNSAIMLLNKVLG